MKKIAILTWLHNGNYGSILQAYALQAFLSEKGYAVENIDYNPTSLERIKNLFQSRNSPLLFYEKLQGKLAYITPQAKENNIRKEGKFTEFLHNSFHLTKTFTRTDDLRELSGRYDAVICGSDQIWSPMLLNPSFYLNFLGNEDRRISYACSFGVSHIPYAKQKKISTLLKKFDFISLREFQGQKIVKSLTGEDCPVLCDPTMLLTEAQWTEIASPQVIDGNYCLIYMLSYHKDYWNHAEKFARNLGLKIVMIPVTKESYESDAILAKDIGPEQWVSLVKNARLVLTDSFHGCVFSIIFNRPFFVYKRFNDQNIKSQNSRLDTLLTQFDLKERIISTYDCFPEVKENDHAKLCSLIAALRDDSARWLQRAINGEI